MLDKVNGRWCIISETTRRPLAFYSGTEKPSDEWIAKQEARIAYFREDLGITNSITRLLFRGSYVKAAKHLKDVLDKEKKSGNSNPDKHHHAFEVAKQYQGVDHKKLAMMVETLEILENLGYNNLLTEVVNTPGYKPIGIAEFFRFMSHPHIPQEDKTEVKRLSVAHSKNPKAGHDQKIREIFDRHGINLGEVIKKKVDEAIKPDILPISGAGQEGTDTLCNNYRKATPGQFQRIKQLLSK